MPEETALHREFVFSRSRFLMVKEKALSEREVLELVKRERYKEVEK